MMFPNRALIAKLESLPTIESAAASTTLPFGHTWQMAYDVPERSFTPAELSRGDAPWGEYRFVTNGFFRTLEIPFLRGRDFSESGLSPVAPGTGCTQTERCEALVDRTLAQTLWPTEDPLGRTVGAQWMGWFQVVGIVANAASSVRGGDPVPMLYLPQDQQPRTSLQVIVRTRATVRETEGAIRSAVQSIDAQVPVTSVRVLSDDLWEAAERARLTTILIGSFALVALLLAAIGVYGVMAFSASQRRREMAIRLALGSTAQRLERRELLGVARLCAAGAATGGLLTFGALRLLGAGAVLEQTLGTWSISPTILLTPPVILIIAALLAGWIPARQASRVDPLEALKEE